MERRDVVRSALERLSEFCAARRIYGWLSRRADRAHGGALGAGAICEPRGACPGRSRRRGRAVKILLVDLETAWRGGQNQALLLLKGLRDRGHEAELVAANSSALGQRAGASGLRVQFVSRGFFRVP